jgi:predicted transposase YbfD/YdcC
VDEKSNEITAIPKLLKMLEIKNCLITIDAMGCRKKIAQQIVDAEADYYIMSRKLSAEKFAETVRGHWSIENRLHWQLDVTFQEDQSRVRKGHADANFSILRRTALSLLKNNKTSKVGVKNKRLTAGWNEDDLAEVLFGK